MTTEVRGHRALVSGTVSFVRDENRYSVHTDKRSVATRRCAIEFEPAENVAAVPGRRVRDLRRFGNGVRPPAVSPAVRAQSGQTDRRGRDNAGATRECVRECARSKRPSHRRSTAFLADSRTSRIILYITCGLIRARPVSARFSSAENIASIPVRRYVVIRSLHHHRLRAHTDVRPSVRPVFSAAAISREEGDAVTCLV